MTIIQNYGLSGFVTIPQIQKKQFVPDFLASTLTWRFTSTNQNYRVETSEGTTKVESSANTFLLSQEKQSQTSSFQLLRHAVIELDSLAIQNPSSSEDVGYMRQLLGFVIQDGFPTPQVALSGSADVETRWLVGEEYLSITSVGDGEFVALHYTGTLLTNSFDIEINEVSGKCLEVLMIRNILSKMATGIQNRLLMHS